MSISFEINSYTFPLDNNGQKIQRVMFHNGLFISFMGRLGYKESFLLNGGAIYGEFCVDELIKLSQKLKFAIADNLFREDLCSKEKLNDLSILVEFSINNKNSMNYS